MKTLTQERLKKLMFYDPISGNLAWKGAVGHVRKGSLVGTMRHDGYLQCRVDGKSYLGHRLAWLYVHGYFPENGLDHTNRDRADNRIDNLREASKQCNARNAGLLKRNKSGIRGVSWYKTTSKWRAHVRVDGKDIHLGLYRCKINAACARLAAEQCIGWAGCDSNSPAYQYVRHNIQKKKVAT